MVGYAQAEGLGMALAGNAAASVRLRRLRVAIPHRRIRSCHSPHEPPLRQMSPDYLEACEVVACDAGTWATGRFEAGEGGGEVGDSVAFCAGCDSAGTVAFRFSRIRL
jgi:hypothetical protein